MQIHQRSPVSANNDLAPVTNSSSRQKNWTNTIANITGLTTGLTVFTILTADVIFRSIRRGVACEWLSQNGRAIAEDCIDRDCCTNRAFGDAMIAMLITTALSLALGICSGKVTQLALRALQTSPQIENKISTEQKA